MKARVVHGFDYRTQVPASMTMSEWRAQMQRVIDAGGSTRRIAGDLSAFNAKGRMVFEIYDEVGREHIENR